MEGKAVLFKQFGGVDAYPGLRRCARTVDEMVAIGKAIAPTFGGINLEDIKAPECFEIERRLQEANSTSPCSTTTSTERRSWHWRR
jgi:malate dehydrogenase (oxaloacetate-decarboxylating)